MEFFPQSSRPMVNFHLEPHRSFDFAPPSEEQVQHRVPHGPPPPWWTPLLAPFEGTRWHQNRPPLRLSPPKYTPSTDDINRWLILTHLKPGDPPERPFSELFGGSRGQCRPSVGRPLSLSAPVRQRRRGLDPNLLENSARQREADRWHSGNLTEHLAPPSKSPLPPLPLALSPLRSDQPRGPTANSSGAACGSPRSVKMHRRRSHCHVAAQ